MNKKKGWRNNKKLWYITVIVIFLFSSIGIAFNYNVIIQWLIPNHAPSIVLIHPADNETFGVNTTYFLWNSTDSDGDIIYHVWYADITSNFISPFARAVDVGIIENYTNASSFQDGQWYWRVEATDNITINVSEVWRFLIKTNMTNNAPSLSTPQVLPTVGYTTTNFIYDVVYTDINNDTAAYVNVIINGTSYNMTEVDPSDTNVTNGKEYSYTTFLTTGPHDYLMICSDGVAINSTDKYYNPIVLFNQPPIIYQTNKNCTCSNTTYWNGSAWIVNVTCESQLNISTNITHATETHNTIWNSPFWDIVFNVTGNQTGLVVVENIVNTVGTHEYQYRPLLGVNGEWWVWANYTGLNITAIYLFQNFINSTGTHHYILNSTGYQVWANVTGNASGVNHTVILPVGSNTISMTIISSLFIIGCVIGLLFMKRRNKKKKA